MEIVKDIKETARKTTNSITDSVEHIFNKPKTPKELASRLVEHLSHKEYRKMAEVITEEARKYASRLGLEDLDFVNDKLDQFESSMDDLATNLEENNYREVIVKLKAIEASIPVQEGQQIGVLKFLKGFVSNIINTLEQYLQEQSNSTSQHEPSYKLLQDTFEKSFNELTNK